MKKLLIIPILVLLAQVVTARDIINFNRDWKFNEGVFLDKVYEEVNLPHTWNSSTDGSSFFKGSATYFKEFKVPPKWMEKRVFMRFNGVATVSNLFINGRYVGEHRGAYTSFTYEITPFLIFGEFNSVMVNVNNAPQLDVMPIVGDMNVYGGIYRDVEIIVVDKNHISLTDYSSDGVYITPGLVSASSASVSANVLLDGRSGSNVDITLAVYSDTSLVKVIQERAKIESNGKTQIQIPFNIENPHLWNGMKDPFMYNVKVTTRDATGGSDEVTVPLGLRTVAVDRERGFLLNGEPYPLRGVNKHQDRSSLGSALRRVHHAEDIDIITSMGATAVRMAFAPQDEYVYDLCDREGLIVWSDLPFVGDEMFMGKGFVDSYAFRANGERQLIEMIRQNYNHPSVVFWGIFSEITAKGDNPIMYIQQLNTIAHRESPGRLTAASSNENGDINFITDVIGWSQYFGWRDGDVSDINLWLDGFRNDWKNLLPAISEYGAGANVLHQQQELVAPAYMGNWHPENWQTHFHEQYLRSIEKAPFMWGTFINSMFDYGSYKRREGGMSGYNDMGLVTYDRHTKKDAYYFYKANWNDQDPFVYIAERRSAKRTSLNSNIKVFTNLSSVELIVNGASLGVKDADLGIVTFDNVAFKKGINKVLVFSGRYKDNIEIEVLDELAQ